VEQRFNNTIAGLVGTMAETALPGTALWWRSMPGGHAGCADTFSPTKPIDPKMLGTDCAPSGRAWGAGTLAERFCWARMPRLNALAADIFARAGHGVLAAERPVLLRPDARIAGAEASVKKLRATAENATYTPPSNLFGSGDGHFDCLHFCMSSVPVLYAVAIMRIALMRGATPRLNTPVQDAAVLGGSCTR